MLHHVWRPAAAVAGLAFAAGLAFGGTAQAESVQKQCSAKYQSAKSSNSLNGETWNQFYKQCATELKGGSAAAPAQTSAPASAPPPATTTHSRTRGEEASLVAGRRQQFGRSTLGAPAHGGRQRRVSECRFPAIFQSFCWPCPHGDLRRAISRQ